MGNLRDWSVINEIPNIEASTLLLNGRYDEVGDNAMQPFFDKISRVKWVTFEQSSHLSHWEERSRFMQVVAHFLTQGA